MSTEPLLTSRETAELLRVKERQLRNLRNRGIIPYVKLGGAVRFIPEQLRQTLTERSIARRATP